MTPTLQRYHAEHRARLGRIAARAVADTPIDCRSASRRELERPAPAKVLQEAPAEWVRRQLELYPKPAKPIYLAVIRREVSRFYAISVDELESCRKTRKEIRPRHVAFYLSKRLSTRSLPKIGRFFGGFDHTTVLHAFQKIDRLRRIDPVLAEEIDVLTDNIKETAQ